MTLRSKLTARQRVPRKPSTREKTNANKVVAKAMEFVTNKNPYCYGGSGDMLCKSNKSKVEYYKSKFGDASNWDHILGDDVDDNGKNWKWTLSENETKYKLVDCSGMTRYVYKEAMGLTLSHGSGDQNTYGKNSGTEVSMANAQPGDLLCKSGHVGIVGPDGKTAMEAKGWKWGCTYDRAITGFTNCYHITGDQYDPNNAGTETGSDPGDQPDPGTQTGETQDLLTPAEVRSAIIYNKKNSQSLCKQIQELVGVYPDGSFGEATVQAIARWQKSKGLEVDGQFGPASKSAAGFNSSAPQGGASSQIQIVLTSAQSSSAISYNKRNNQSICTQIQNLVNVTPDGIFGTMTVNAIANWQAKNNLEADGKFGPMSKSVAGL